MPVEGLAEEVALAGPVVLVLLVIMGLEDFPLSKAQVKVMV